MVSPQDSKFRDVGRGATKDEAVQSWRGKQEAQWIYVLLLNDMRNPQSEVLEPAAWSTSEQWLIDFVRGELVKPYTEPLPPEEQAALRFDRAKLAKQSLLGRVVPTAWRKAFRKGGPLEWWNPPTFLDEEYPIKRLAARNVDGMPIWNDRAPQAPCIWNPVGGFVAELAGSHPVLQPPEKPQ